MRLRRALLPLFTAFALLSTAASAAPAPTPVVGAVLVSLDTIGHPLNAPSGAYSYPAAISSDGRYVAFESLAAIDALGDHNNVEDIFLRDTTTPLTSLISVASDGTQGNNRSYAPAISADGSFIAFETLASNLAAGDANNASDIFLRDVAASTTTRVSAATGGADANGASFRPAISGDGAYVAFCSRASNLVAGDDGASSDLFVFARATGTLTRVAVPGLTNDVVGGCERVAIDSDGGVLVFAALQRDRSDVYAYDRASGATTPLTDSTDGSSGMTGLAISGDGKHVAFDSTATNLVPGDSNRSRDVFVRDLGAEATTRVSVRTDGSQLPGDSGASGVAISGDGSVVAFSSQGTEVVPGDSNGREDVFRRDLSSNQTTIVSVSAADRSANDASYAPAITPDGATVAYASLAANVINGDSNRQPDVFLRSAPFPGNLGVESAPEDTGAPADITSLPASGNSSGVPVALVGGGIAAGIVVLAGAWFLLGRRGRA